MQIQADIEAKLRIPQQGRSRASFERMMDTAERLMAERGSDDFTLSEVAKLGRVSNGSIYLRFDSKDDLVHAVQLRVLERVDSEVLLALARVRERNRTFSSFVRALVEVISENLRKHAAVMRPFMLRSTSDPVVAALGKSSYLRSATAVRDAFLDHRTAIRHPEPEHAVDAAYRMLYASLARYLGFGSAMTAAGEGDWDQLKRDLSDMVVAYLRSSNPGADEH